MNVIEKIIEFRKERGLTQKDMAIKLGIAPLNYGKIEKGITKLTVDRLFEIAKIFKVHVNSLIPDYPVEEFNFRLFYYMACHIVGCKTDTPNYKFYNYWYDYKNTEYLNDIEYQWFNEFIEFGKYKDLLEKDRESIDKIDYNDKTDIGTISKQWALFHNTKLFYIAFENEAVRNFLIQREDLINAISPNFIRYWDKYKIEKNIE